MNHMFSQNRAETQCFKAFSQFWRSGFQGHDAKTQCFKAFSQFWLSGFQGQDVINR